MHEEIYADGIGEITVTGSIVRINLVSLSASEMDANGNPTTVFRQRVIMPIDAFANAVDLMDKALAGLVEAGAIRRIGDPKAADGTVRESGDHRPLETGEAARRNGSPNFN